MGDALRRAESGTQVCYVTSAMDATKQSISWLQVVELEIATSQREEKVKIYVIGRVVTFHLKSGESHSKQINEGDVIEFHGPEGTGKTEMLYHLVARCIIPKSGGGLEVEVMFIDTDYHFDMLRLVTILEHRLVQSTEEMIKQCLGRLFLVNCNSSTQLLLTLYSLENMFCTHPSLCLLIVDSISAFYWIDRSNGGESLNLQEMNLKKCANFLEKLVREHHLALFATTQTIMQKSTSSAESFFPLKLQHEFDTDYRPYLCKSWQQMVTHRIFFSKQFNSGNSKGFTVVSCHLKKNNVVKRSFSVAECGVQF